MNCRELINDFLHDYVEGALPLSRKALFELHLAACPSCRDYIDSYRRTIRLAASCADLDRAVDQLPPAPEDLVRAVMASLPSR